MLTPSLEKANILLNDSETPNRQELMRFTLIFEGRLPSASKAARLPEKHRVRRAIHPQLLELFRRNENLPKLPDGRDWAGWTEWKWPHNWKGTGRDNLSWQEEDTVHQLGNLHFVPLVRRSLAIYCELDVLFLRYGEPGSLISGDLDNRILTLSDGLRLPKGDNELTHTCEQRDFGRCPDDSGNSGWRLALAMLGSLLRNSNLVFI